MDLVNIILTACSIAIIGTWSWLTAKTKFSTEKKVEKQEETKWVYEAKITDDFSLKNWRETKTDLHDSFYASKHEDDELTIPLEQ